MLRLISGGAQKDCSGLSRRDFMQVGGLALGSLTLPTLLASRAAANPAFLRDRSVVLLYLSGGASHIETFDPKMTAPAGVRSVTGEVQTPIAGVSYGGTFPELAKRAKQLSVVRSFQHPVGSHDQAHVHVLSGGTDRIDNGAKTHSIGAAYARMRGTNHPETGMPTFSLLTEKEIDGQYTKELSRVTKGSAPGILGPSYSPFGLSTLRDDSQRKRSSKSVPSIRDNMQLSLEVDRFDDRRELLGKLDRLNRGIDSSGSLVGIDKFNQQAVDLILGNASDAFDLTLEDPRLVERYDTSHVEIGFKKFRKSTLGHQMLLARRLCEAGCGFVTVHSAGWDMHADNNNPGMTVGMEMLGRTLDKAVSAFIDDVEQQGLSDKILLVVTGDFGRTPKMNSRGGRDHWSRLATLAFSGGGLEMGQVVGQSARGADVPATDPISTENVMATIMHSLFDVGQLRLQSQLPVELLRWVQNHEPIKQLMG
ncbi:MAG: hypothetical protein ACI9G1_000261 [Pirellulaceae bacterium]|jgi:hypothetical protein